MPDDLRLLNTLLEKIADDGQLAFFPPEEQQQASSLLAFAAGLLIMSKDPGKGFELLGAVARVGGAGWILRVNDLVREESVAAEGELV